MTDEVTDRRGGPNIAGDKQGEVVINEGGWLPNTFAFGRMTSSKLTVPVDEARMPDETRVC